MSTRSLLSVVSLALLYALPASAQAPPAAKNANPGVNPVRLMDRPEVRVTRVEIQPGAVRSVHTHDDVRYHLWVPASGKLEITIGSSRPVAAASGQAFFIEKGTPHGFRNVGVTPAAVLEIFVKDGVPGAKIQTLGVTLGALAKL